MNLMHEVELDCERAALRRLSESEGWGSLEPFPMRLLESCVQWRSDWKSGRITKGDYAEKAWFGLWSHRNDLVDRAREAERLEAISKTTDDLIRKVDAPWDGSGLGFARKAINAALDGGADHDAALKAGQLAIDEWRESDRRRKRDRVVAALRDFFPDDLQPAGLDMARLTNPDEFKAATEGMDFDGDRGLFVFGPTGAGKTRLLAKLAFDAAAADNSVLCYTAGDLLGLWGDMASSGRGAALDGEIDDGGVGAVRAGRAEKVRAHIGFMAGHDVVVIDELFQTFSIPFGENFRKFMDRHKGIILTASQYSPDEALARHTSKRDPGGSKLLEAILRRLNERCYLYTFPRGEL